MKITVSFAKKSVSFSVINGLGITRIGTVFLSDFSTRKNRMLRQIFREGKEYDLIPFFTAWAKFRAFHVNSFISDQTLNSFVEMMKRELEGGADE